MIIDDLWWFMIEFPAESSESLNSSPFQTSGSILCWYQTWTAKLELRRILNGGMTRSSRKHQHHKNSYIDVHFTSFSMIFYDFLWFSSGKHIWVTRLLIPAPLQQLHFPPTARTSIRLREKGPRFTLLGSRYSQHSSSWENAPSWQML